MLAAESTGLQHLLAPADISGVIPPLLEKDCDLSASVRSAAVRVAERRMTFVRGASVLSEANLRAGGTSITSMGILDATSEVSSPSAPAKPTQAPSEEAADDIAVPTEKHAAEDTIGEKEAAAAYYDALRKVETANRQLSRASSRSSLKEFKDSGLVSPGGAEEKSDRDPGSDADVDLDGLVSVLLEPPAANRSVRGDSVTSAWTAAAQAIGGPHLMQEDHCRLYDSGEEPEDDEPTWGADANAALFGTNDFDSVLRGVLAKHFTGAPAPIVPDVEVATPKPEEAATLRPASAMETSQDHRPRPITASIRFTGPTRTFLSTTNTAAPIVMAASPQLAQDLQQARERDEIRRAQTVHWRENIVPAAMRLHVALHQELLSETLRLHHQTLLLCVERRESLMRMSMEQSWFRWNIPAAHTSAVVAIKRALWEREQQRVIQRRLREEEEANMRAVEAECKKMDQDPMSSVGSHPRLPPLQRRPAQDAAVVSPAAAVQELMARAGVVEPAGGGKPTLRPGGRAGTGGSRRDQIQALKLSSLAEDESRMREALAIEELGRFVALRDHCFDAAPTLVFHPDATAILAKRTAAERAAERNVRAAGMEVRDHGAGRRGDVDPSALQQQRQLAQSRALLFEEEAARQEATRHEALEGAALSKAEEEERSVIEAHDARYQQKAAKLQAAKKMETSRQLIAAVALGWLWRSRLRPIVAVKDFVRPLIRSSDREIRQMFVDAGVELDDLAIIERADRPKRSGAPVSNAHQSLPAVERLERPPIEREEDAAWVSLMDAFSTTCDALARLPKAKQGYRVRAATSIQALWRGHVARRLLNGGLRDRLVIARMMRLNFRSQRRAMQDAERSARYQLEDEELASDLGHLQEAFVRHVALRRRQFQAAVRIQSLMRRFLERCKLPRRREAFWAQRFQKLKAKQQARSAPPTAAAAAVALM